MIEKNETRMLGANNANWKNALNKIGIMDNSSFAVVNLSLAALIVTNDLTVLQNHTF